MKISNKGIKFIAGFEGLVLQSYDDANNRKINVGEKAKGTLTIGYGHTTAAGAPTVKPGMVITKAEAEQILAQDLRKVEANVNKLVKVPLTQNQFDALVSFDYNTGSLGKSSALTALNAGNYSLAADKLMLYNKGRINGKLEYMKGLERRRTEERKMFLTKDGSATSTTSAGAIVVATGGAVAATPHNYWPWIIGAGVIALLLVLTGIDIYNFKKAQKNAAIKN